MVALATSSAAASSHVPSPAPRRLRTDLSWEEDYRRRLAPALTTRLAHAAVPALAASGFCFTEVREGACTGMVPLTARTANQHGTHQALVVAMGGDYVGGLAVASLLRGVPILGVHGNPDGEAMSLWLVASELRWDRPSTDDVVIRAEVPEEARAALLARYEDGASTKVVVPVRFTAPDGRAVGQGTFTYFVRSTTALAPTAPGAPAHPMYEHLLRSSATMVAAVRGRERRAAEPAYDDALSSRLAGLQGDVMATRFLGLMPALGEMVAGRTADLDDVVRRAVAEGVEQVVLLAAGLDARPARLAARYPKVRWYAVDQPEMLGFRAERFAACQLNDPAQPVAGDLRWADWVDRLAHAPGFDASRPVVVALEGCSMYLAADELTALLGRVGEVVRRHPASRLWFDVVSAAVAGRQVDDASVVAFLDGIALLGEPFRTGTDDPAAWLEAAGLRPERIARADHHRPRPGDDLFAHYHLVTARAAR